MMRKETQDTRMRRHGKNRHVCINRVGSAVICLLMMLSGAAYGGSRLPEMARKQIGVTVYYDGSYESIPYPGGDVPIERGVCTDVVIRAFRELGYDLQKAVHEDMRAHFSVYPKKWGLKRPDANIDHRRVLNLQTFFTRKGWAVSITDKAADYLPGDLVTCTVGENLPHIMIVSDKKNGRGEPFVIHNIGRGTQEEECLFTFPITGHFRPASAPVK